MKKVFILAACAALSACASARPIDVKTVSDASALAGIDDVTIRLSNFEFAPETIRLKAGQPYRLVLVNAASGGHSFTAPDFFEASRIAQTDAGVVAGGEIEIPAGETRTVSLVPAAGSYDLDCTHFGHVALGMTGKIVVE